MNAKQTKLVRFPDWMTVEEAAKALGKSGARVRQMIEEGDKFSEVAVIGDRPTYLVPRAEVHKMVAIEAKVAAAKAAALAANQAKLDAEAAK